MCSAQRGEGLIGHLIVAPAQGQFAQDDYVQHMFMKILIKLACFRRLPDMEFAAQQACALLTGSPVSLADNLLQNRTTSLLPLPHYLCLAGEQGHSSSGGGEAMRAASGSAHWQRCCCPHLNTTLAPSLPHLSIPFHFPCYRTKQPSQ